MNELTPYEIFQLERHGDILCPLSLDSEIENGFQEAERFREWTDQEAEIRLIEEDHL